MEIGVGDEGGREGRGGSLDVEVEEEEVSTGDDEGVSCLGSILEDEKFGLWWRMKGWRKEEGEMLRESLGLSELNRPFFLEVR